MTDVHDDDRFLACKRFLRAYELGAIYPYLTVEERMEQQLQPFLTEEQQAQAQELLGMVGDEERLVASLSGSGSAETAAAILALALRRPRTPKGPTVQPLLLNLEQRSGGLTWQLQSVDCFYGEDRGVQQAIRDLGKSYVLALKPSDAWWHPIDSIGSLHEAARAAGWRDPTTPGAWVQIERAFRDGHTETWWALEVTIGPYGPENPIRAVVAATEPVTLRKHGTWYLSTNLPAPDSARAHELAALPSADLAEIIRLYGLRNWVEQSDKQTKAALGWSDYRVRRDRAIRRHWTLVCCAFTFCWYHHSRCTERGTHPAQTDPVADEATGRGENGAHAAGSAAGVLARRAPGGADLAGTLDSALTLLDRVVESAPTSTTPVAA